VLAAAAAQRAGDGAAVLAAVAGLLVGVALARHLLRRWNARLTPVLLGRGVPAACTPVPHGDAARGEH
jgi:sigma-E factor negative regulatory protein RseC